MAKDLHKIWGHRWLTPKAKPGKSKIHGWGTFAIKDIKAGEIIRVIGGIVLQKKDLEKYHQLIGEKYETRISGDFFLAPSRKEEVTKESGMLNHGCNPNVGFGDTITIVTIRNIKTGGELVADYAMDGLPIEPFICKCGSANCRKIIKPDDWKNPEIRKKYGSRYFAPFLKKRFV